MAYGARTPNSVEVLAAKDSVSGLSKYVTSTNGKLDVNATASLAGTALPISGATTAVGVAIVDSSGNQISSFGGGTQYTNGSAQATPTGTVALGYDGANVRALKTGSDGTLAISAASLPLPTGAATAAKQPALGTAGTASADVITVQGIASMTALKVDASGTTVTVSGTVTANAGTNLNTSALALESGGNLAGINGKIKTAAAITSAMANPTVGGIQSFPMGYNGTTWDQFRNINGLGGDNDGLGVAGEPIGVGARNWYWNGSSWDRIRGDTTGAWTSMKSISGVAGQKTMANSLPVTIASDQSTLTVTQATSTTDTNSSVAASATSVSLLSSNASRKGATIFNDSSAILYLLLGATASTTAYNTQIQPNGYYEVPYNYTGAIAGIWSSATGNARVNELT